MHLQIHRGIWRGGVGISDYAYPTPFFIAVITVQVTCSDSSPSWIDYDKEVFRQLNDESVYRPSTPIEYDNKAADFIDKT